MYSADRAVGYLDNLDAARNNSFISDASSKSFEVSIAGFDELPIAEDQLIRDLSAPAGHVGPALTDLELDGKIERRSGGLLSLAN